MAKEALNANSFTKEERPNFGLPGVFGLGRFGSAKFGAGELLYPKEALPVNSLTKEALTSLIT